MNNEAFKNFSNQDFNNLAKWIYKLNAYEFTIIATALGTIISSGLTINQQNSLGNFFEQIGQTLLTIGAQNTVLKHNNRRVSNIKKENFTSLEEEIRLIKQELIALRKDALNNDNN